MNWTVEDFLGFGIAVAIGIIYVGIRWIMLKIDYMKFQKDLDKKIETLCANGIRRMDEFNENMEAMK